MKVKLIVFLLILLLLSVLAWVVESAMSRASSFWEQAYIALKLLPVFIAATFIILVAFLVASLVSDAKRR